MVARHRTKFTALLDRLVPTVNVKSEDRRVYYRLRSAPAHGGKLLQDDMSLWHMNMASFGERRDLRTLGRIVQAALYNSLLQSFTVQTQAELKPI